MQRGTALNIAEIPVFILCGGLGTRLKEMTEFRPKPMVTIGPDPRFGISWPAPPQVISDKDAQQRDFDPAWHLEG
jgi:hypothetical protein